MQRIGQLNESVETARRAREFVDVARYLALSHGDAVSAAASAEANRATPSIIAAIKASDHVKASVAPGSTIDPAWAAPVAQYQAMADGFVASLQNASAFDRLLGDMRPVPLHTGVAVTTVGASGSIVAEAKPVPISKIELAARQLAEHKAVAAIAVSM